MSPAGPARHSSELGWQTTGRFTPRCKDGEPEIWNYEGICTNSLYRTHFGICPASLYPHPQKRPEHSFLNARSSHLSQDIWAPGRRSPGLNSSYNFLFESTRVRPTMVPSSLLNSWHGIRGIKMPAAISGFQRSFPNSDV